MLRSYYPDFLVEMRNGAFIIVEIKGEDKIDDAVVLAKARYATAMAEASAMTYQMIPSKNAGYGLHQPQSIFGN